MKKALVTGANGFVGSAVVKELLLNGIEVIALGREGRRNNIPKEARFVAYELKKSMQISELVPDRDIDVFYHFAWEGSSGEERADEKLQLDNARWTIDSLRVAKVMNCKCFISAGTIMEREVRAATYKQGNRLEKRCIYGTGKLAAHMMTMAVAADLGIDAIWAEISNTYGVGSTSSRFIDATILKIINNEPLKFTAGTQNYDFVYIDDVARAFRLIGEKGKPFGDYLIGSQEARPLREFILDIKEELAPEREFIFGDVVFAGGNMPIEEFDCSLTEKDTGFRAEISFREGIRRTMDWLKNGVEYGAEI